MAVVKSVVTVRDPLLICSTMVLRSAVAVLMSSTSELSVSVALLLRAVMTVAIRVTISLRRETLLLLRFFLPCEDAAVDRLDVWVDKDDNPLLTLDVADCNLVMVSNFV